MINAGAARDGETVYVMSGYGQTDWLRNLEARPEVQVAIGAERWVELFRAFGARPVLFDAWQILVREIAALLAYEATADLATMPRELDVMNASLTADS